MAACLNMKLLQSPDYYHLQHPVYYLFIDFHLIYLRLILSVVSMRGLFLIVAPLAFLRYRVYM